MRTLSKKEINQILTKGRRLSSLQITDILDDFQEDQPEVYQTIYGEPSDAIAEKNPDMASMFLELCFDVIWIYRNAFGKLPTVPVREELVLNSLSLLDLELKSFSDDITMDEAFRSSLQERFINRIVAAGIQIELLQHLDSEVRTYASFKQERSCAINMTYGLLFVVVRLMDDLYDKKK
ncbi:MAG: hypothetical protein NTY51_07435 [Deltaproteobacteria bacterium]|nr:hypothetical protein [Deltaproteobacteria bacterium]